ncbi:hypothetical protein [Chondromyces crocatus]|uniref:Uncharacterized protein n=1 Tax=Chondromyces crocatus TaxID=52 RepID=A0A0K1E5T6_CHOCO|nr:hypothetical protein [Chondromyces crocatus]AKT36204.1 uncharacterized protein CMC5_003180 [Chondromyces crocatus]
MLAVFEVYLVRGKTTEEILSAEIIKETSAQVMTIDEAKKVGFAGLEPMEGVGEVRLIAVAQRDAPWIHRTLEGSSAVASFRMHEVG